MCPSFFLNIRAKRLLSSCRDDEYVRSRVDYYNKLNVATPLSSSAMRLDAYVYVKPSTYYYDLKQYVDRFPDHFLFQYAFGDVIHIPDSPTIVKSRPIEGANDFSIIMNLNKIRHFIFSNDKLSFVKKKPTLVWRGNVLDHQVNRQAFLMRYANAPNMDIGHVNDYGSNACKVRKLSINQQLKYKFILSIEGNDVASNLKWIMSSSSLCFMCKPRYETWFMEGTLEAGVHYVQIEDDYSDLDDKLNYYTENEDKALRIIKNANRYVEQFKNRKRERLISLLVLDKYFKLTN